MKTKHFFYSTMLIALFFVLFSTYSKSQIISGDIKLNTLEYFDVSMDGSDYIAVDGENIYVIWQGAHSESESYIYFCKSTNGGDSFSEETAIYTGPTEAIHVIGSIDVASNTIYISWTVVTNGEEEWNIWFTKSTDGGTTFSSPYIITTNNSSIMPIVKAYNNYAYIFYASAASYPMVDYYFTKSDDYGNSWSPATQINDQACTSSVYFSNLNAMEIGSDGNIYLAWTDGRNPNSNGDIFFSKSTDSGTSFSTNVMVNDITNIDSDSIQYYPNIGIGSDNNVFVSFDDMRLGSENSFNSRIYISKSNDGGSSFASEEMFSEISDFCKFGNFASNDEEFLCFTALASFAEGFGLYLFESTTNGANFLEPIPISDAFDADASDLHSEMNTDKDVFMIWIDQREGIDDKNIYFSKYDFQPMGTDITNTAKSNIYPNPAKDIIKINQHEEFSWIKIYSISGNLILNQKLTNEIDISKIPSGIYTIKLISKDKAQSEKLIKL